MIQQTRKKITQLILGSLCIYAVYSWNSNISDCGPDTGADFQKEFTYITSTSERCGESKANCEARFPHWKKPIVVNVESIGVSVDKIDEVCSITLRALGEIREVTPIKIVHESQMEQNLIVFIMNDQMLDRLTQPDATALDFRPGSLHRMAYDDQSCTFRLWATPLSKLQPNQSQTVSAAAIFVHQDKKGIELQHCIYEEVAGAVGLTNDPEGQATLLTPKNYVIKDGQFRYSDRILLMFDALYKIAFREYPDIKLFCAARREITT